MKQPMWDSKAVKAYETGQGVELVNKPYPHYIPNTKGKEQMTGYCPVCIRPYPDCKCASGDTINKRLRNNK